MLKDLFKKSGNEDEQKRKMENIVVFIIILIITVLVINSMWSKDKESTENKVTDSSKVLANTDTTEGRTEEELEDKLADILETINGVGKVFFDSRESSYDAARSSLFNNRYFFGFQIVVSVKFGELEGYTYE